MKKTVAASLLLAALAMWAGGASARTTLKTLHTFAGGKAGSRPLAPLVQGTDGNLYGTTFFTGNASGGGTVFKISTGGVFSILHIFKGGTSDGWTPMSGLTEGTDGRFYGTTTAGGTYNMGIVYAVSATGAVSILHSFSGVDSVTGFDNGSGPVGGLLLASDGNFYGTTYGGFGTVFRLSPSGAYSVLYGFSGLDGSGPEDALVEGQDGALYGTTSAGGATYSPGGSEGYGSVFRISLEGVLTSLYSFSGPDGSDPTASLAVAGDGFLYGSTEIGGVGSFGTIFSMSMTGSFDTLCSLASAAPTAPGKPSGLTLGQDGNFYGTVQMGGLASSGYGGVFKITPSGQFTSLITFNGKNGDTPVGGVVQGTDGSFYGTTSSGGRSDFGTVFKLTQ